MTTLKPLTVWIITNCGKLLVRWEYQTILPVSGEATVRTLFGTTDWFKKEKGVRQGCLLSPCLFNLYAEHIMRKDRLDELQAGIKIGGRNINNLRYVNDGRKQRRTKEPLDEGEGREQKSQLPTKH